MRLLRLLPDETHYRFMRLRRFAFLFTLVLTLASLGACFGLGFNLGVDYAGGLLVEVRTTAPYDLANLRQRLNALQLGDVTLQAVGNSQDLLIRLPAQPGGDAAQSVAVAQVTG